MEIGKQQTEVGRISLWWTKTASLPTAPGVLKAKTEKASIKKEVTMPREVTKRLTPLSKERLNKTKEKGNTSGHPEAFKHP